MWTRNRLQERITDLDRLLRIERLATDEELQAVDKSYPGKTKDQLWLKYAELRSFARRKEWAARQDNRRDDADSFQVAQAALEDRAEVCELPSINRTVRVVPASWLRIMRVEDLDWWIIRLVAARLVLKAEADSGKKIENLAELLERINEEIGNCKNLLYAEITAEGPAPANTTVEWGNSITPDEEIVLMELWHQVNTERLRLLPKPKPKKDKKPLPRSWALVFQSVAWRERRPPIEIVRDRSLVSICAATVLEAIKHDEGAGSSGLDDLD